MDPLHRRGELTDEENTVIPETTTRVPLHTAEHVNDKIRRRTEANVARYAHASPDEIGRRLAELDREWDIERTLETNAASLSLVGLTLGATVDRKWFLLPGAIAAFLLQHAVQGWCPPIPILRRMGIRTATEIDEERYALKALRGDFRDVPVNGDGNEASRQAMAAVRR